MQEKPIRKSLVYLSVPQVNGMFTFYKNLRAGLKPFGWDVICLTIGAAKHREYDPDFADDGCISLVPAETDLQRQIHAFLDWCEVEKPDVVIPMDSEPGLLALPSLPPEIQVVMRCAYTSSYGYWLITQSPDRVSHIVAQTARHVSDLICEYHVPSEKITLIEHGPDMARFARAQTGSARNNKTLQVGYLGRLEHTTKGVLDIPSILDQLELTHIDYHLRIAGWGPDGDNLKHQVEGFLRGGKVSFDGTITPDEVPGFLAKTDVLLFPSHEEGFSNSLVEAMAAGCVPVASSITGVTDFIIEDGKTGLLCRPAAANEFAEGIARLGRDRALLRQMSRAAIEEVDTRFSSRRMIVKYATLFNALVNATPTNVSSSLHGTRPLG